MAETIVIRPIQLQDIAQLNHLYKGLALIDGEHIFRLVFLNTDSSLWQVAVNEKGEVVGTYRGIKLDLKEMSVMHGCRQAVRADYQRRGIAVSFRKAIKNLPVIGNATLEAIARLSWFKKFSLKLIGYSGHPTSKILRGLFPSEGPYDFVVAELQHQDIENLLTYDRTIFDYDRGKFMRAWCEDSKNCEPYSKTVIAKSKIGGSVLGFGTIRRFGECYRLVPVYAEKAAVAQEILKALTKFYIDRHSQDPLRVYFDARNRTMLEYVKQMEFEHGYTTVRAYTRGMDGKGRPEVIEEYVKAESVYIYQYYWPV